MQLAQRQYFLMCSISLDNHYVYVVFRKKVYRRNVITELFSFLFEEERQRRKTITNKK